MSTRWSEAITHQFVRMYLKKHCLWNTSDPAYKDKHSRQGALFALADEFRESTGHSITICDIKRKIKNLRSTYSQQVHKITTNSRDPTQLYEPTLVWFREMDDCLKHLVKAPILDNSGEGEEETDSKVWAESEAENPEVAQADPLVLPPSRPNVERRLADVRRTSTMNHIKKKKRRLKMKRERVSPGYHSGSDAERTEPRPAACVEDEFDVYGKYVASQMRRVSLQRALRLQMEINRLISGVRLAEASDVLETD